MKPLPPGQKLVIASHNPGKVREIAALLQPLGLQAVSAAELNLPEPVEDGDTFEANALIKARAAAEGANLPALADDSGLCVDALGGQPGIHSARWGGPEKDFDMAMRRLHEELQQAGATTDAQRKAHFVCVLALAWPDGEVETFRGEVHGHITWPPRGEKGFGYDPIFVPDGYDITFAEMEPEKKHAMSHRADAFNKLLAALRAAQQS